MRVIAPDVGGGFGQKITVYPEEIAIPFAAMRLYSDRSSGSRTAGRTSWPRHRQEDKEQTVTIEAAVTEEGILGTCGPNSSAMPAGSRSTPRAR